MLCIRALSLPYCSYSSWYWKRFCVSSGLVCHGSLPMLTTWCFSRTLWRCVFPRLRRGWLAWDVKDSVSTWRSTVLMSSRNLTSTPVLSATKESVLTPSSDCSAHCWSTQDAMASLVDWWLTKIMLARGLTADQHQSLCQCCNMLHGLGKLHEILACPHTQLVSIRLCNTVRKRWG